MTSVNTSPPKRRRTRGSRRANENESEENDDVPSTPCPSRTSKGAHLSYRLGVSKQAPTPYSTPFRSRNQTVCAPNVKDANVKRAVGKLKSKDHPPKYVFFNNYDCTPIPPDINVAELLKKQWYVFNVSPLFNLNYNEAHLKRYARRLREKLTARLSDESTVEYEVSYALYPNLQLNDMDDEAIEVFVL